jgi:4-carboxymuconolactone decarboxylase
MEAFLHVAIYAGVPRANHAIKLAPQTFAEMEERPMQNTPRDAGP